MTACPKWKDRLLDFALGVPPPRALQAHLKICPACSAAWVEFRARREHMDGLLPRLMHGIEPSAALRARLMASLGEPLRRGHGWRLPVGAIPAFALVLLLAVFLVSSGHRRIGLTKPAKVSTSTGGLGEWHSPTAYLLSSPAEQLLQPGPRLGQFYFPLHSTPLGRGGSKKRME